MQALHATATCFFLTFAVQLISVHMPSLSTNNRNSHQRVSSFHYFVGFAESPATTEKDSTFATLIFFLRFIFTVSLLCASFNVPYYFFYYFWYHWDKVYYQDQIYFFKDITLLLYFNVWIYSFVFYFIPKNFLFVKQSHYKNIKFCCKYKWNTDKYHITLTTSLFLMNFCLNGLFGCLLRYMKVLSNTNEFSSNAPTSDDSTVVAVTDSAATQLVWNIGCDKWFDCAYFEVWYIYWFIILAPFYSILTFMMVLMLDLIDIKLNNNDKINSNNKDELRLNLLTAHAHAQQAEFEQLQNMESSIATTTNDSSGDLSKIIIETDKNTMSSFGTSMDDDSININIKFGNNCNYNYDYNYNDKCLNCCECGCLYCCIDNKIDKLQLKLNYYFIWYFVIYFCFNYVMYILFKVKRSVISQKWEYWYNIFLIINVIGKWSMKRVARKIDNTRIRLFNMYQKESDDNYDNPNQMKNATAETVMDDDDASLSLEWLTEILMSFYYFLNYRYFLAYFLPNIGVWSLLFTLTIHLISEAIETTLKISQFYYNLRGKMQTVEKFDDICCGFGLYMRMKAYDDCLYSQWTIRHSIDIMARAIIGIISVILELVWFIPFGQTIYNLSSEKYSNAITYNLIALFMELIYFAIAYAMAAKYCNCDLAKMFKMLYKKQSKTMIFFFVLFQVNIIFSG